MSRLEQSETRNCLLSSMDRSDFALLEPSLELCSLREKDIVVRPYKPIEHVYFPESALVSELAVSQNDHRIEVGTFGREGFAGHPLLAGTDRTPNMSIIQVAGTAQRMSAAAFLAVLEQSPGLRGLFSRYAYYLTVMISETALAAGRFNVEQRLARWLLICQDRLGSDRIPLTHQFLSLMLGVRRAGVTQAMHVLEGDHLVKASRGLIVVTDRPGLIAAAGDCYGTPEAEYDRVVAPCFSTAARLRDQRLQEMAVAQRTA